MRIAELSKVSGVPAPTIKYYMREGLLFPGERTSPNQMQYDDSHVRRLKLVRALIEVGGLSVAATREVLDKMRTPGMTVLESAGKAQFAMSRPPAAEPDETQLAAAEQVRDLIARRGWQVRETNPARGTLAAVLATLGRLGQEHWDLLDDYAELAERIAAKEIDTLLRQPNAESMAEALVVWTALGDAMFSALRRLAHEDAASAYIATPAPTS
ncbi:MerR family transcriptional regulator [Nocardia sp. NPDC050793]|uniref:MerR family transcriptional regulator n=1 Tax=Nocardia sp. NPDC050793 TaxID=3155159 RepID=UPI0033E8ACF2